MDHEATIDELTRWAAEDENIRAVVVTGSVARGDHDELSDIDVELCLRAPSDLLGRGDWYDRFGDVLAVEELENPGWLPTRLLYLVDGKIDFAIGDLDAFGTEPYTRPFWILIDKDNRAEHLDAAAPPRHSPPSAEEVSECVNWFAAAALMQAKLIVRRDLWAAKYRDWDLKRQLLRIMVWDHRCRHGWDYDTWFNGKHINDWADADVREDIDACWAGFQPDEMPAALHASMDLFQLLAERTAHALGQPPFDHARVRAEVDRILALRETK